jgi:hypothetical protein
MQSTAYRLGTGLWIIALAAVAVGWATPAVAQTEGDYLYRVTMARAAPGQWVDLIATLRESFEIDRDAGDPAPFWMRHSQGDQWDFMLIHPMGEQSSYHSPDREQRRAAAWATPRGREIARQLEAYIAYKEEWYARTVSLDELTRRFEGQDFYHVEMFAGLPGKRAELVEQRRMENRYYEHLGRQQNLIFVRDGGPNWDAMTVGFYENLQAYAAAGVRHTAEEQEAAARAAGFDGIGAISPYLRSLLSYHHDTLAVRIE